MPNFSHIDSENKYRKDNFLHLIAFLHTAWKTKPRDYRYIYHLQHELSKIVYEERQKEKTLPK